MRLTMAAQEHNHYRVVRLVVNRFSISFGAAIFTPNRPIGSGRQNSWEFVLAGRYVCECAKGKQRALRAWDVQNGTNRLKEAIRMG